MINKDLMRRTLAYIEEHPSEWDQEKWVCGTVACFAGRACLLSDYRPCNVNGDPVVPGPDDESADAETGWVRRGGEIVDVEYKARILLGLDVEEADELFDMGNTLADLRGIVEAHCND